MRINNSCVKGPLQVLRLRISNYTFLMAGTNYVLKKTVNYTNYIFLFLVVSLC